MQESHIPPTITIYKSAEEVPHARWLAVIIDVFRAFSVECYILHNGASYIIPVQTLDEAYALKKENPDYILVGERWWIKPDWFDYGNSPTELLNVDFTDKIIVHTTMNGTKGLMLATQADDIVTGSFVNASAILRYIKETKPEIVSLVSTSHLATENNEDILFANYISDTLQGETVDQKYIREMMQKTWAYALLFDEIGVPATDFDLCLEDRFPFIIKQEEQDGRRILIKIDI